MMDFGVAWQGVLMALTPECLLLTLVGVVVALIFGIIPGIGAAALMSITLPLTYKMEPALALSLLIAEHAVTMTGGSVTAIVANVPGTGANAATLLDGFPLARKGKAARAIGVALTASGVGGVLGGVVLVLLIPAAYAIVMSIRAAESFLLALLGLSFIAVLSRGSTVKGIISGAIGILLSFIGLQGQTAIPRFTFGQLWLYEGIELVPLVIGLFALPQIMELALTKKSIAATSMETNWHEVLEGAKDVFRMWKLFIRSCIVGVVVGIIPGIGADTAIFVAYAQAKQTSKHPELFGTGVIEGVLAPEAANNAKEGGSMLPTLAFGIPGSAMMAIILGAFLVHGISPGPTMLKEHLDVSFAMITTLIISNVLGAAIMFPVARYVATICLIPATILVPLIVIIALFGCYAATYSISGIIFALVFAVLGFVMIRYDYNRVAMLLGFILGEIVEKNVFITAQVEGLGFLTRLFPLILVALIVVVLFGSQFKQLYKGFLRKREGRAA